MLNEVENRIDSSHVGLSDEDMENDDDGDWDALEDEIITGKDI